MTMEDFNTYAIAVRERYRELGEYQGSYGRMERYRESDGRGRRRYRGSDERGSGTGKWGSSPTDMRVLSKLPKPFFIP